MISGWPTRPGLVAHDGGAGAPGPDQPVVHSIASQPSSGVLASGRVALVKTTIPASAPAGIAVISRPTVSGLPPSACAYGTARPSGTT